MQNTKIQALWQLTQELKEKRQQLVEKMHYNQSYLDQQQHLMQTELHGLQHETRQLETDLQQFCQALESLHQQWQQQPGTSSAGDPRLNALQQHFAAAAAERRLAGELLGVLTVESQAVYQPLLDDFDTWQAYYQQSVVDTDPTDEALEQCEAFLAEFTPAWAEHKAEILSQLQAPVVEESPASDQGQAEAEALQAELAELQQHLSAREAELSSLQEAYQALEASQAQADTSAADADKLAEAEAALQQVQTVQTEFEALRDSNHQLSNDLEQLRSHTDKLIELVETYRQAALEAVQQAEAAEAQAAEAQSTASPSEGSTEESSEAGSKAEAAREAVRKKTVVLLRHRLGKVPRKINQALKDISQNSTLDKLFELALSVESIADFEAALED
ncbi:MAG: hypothetical protein IGS03_17830 [Candidatus Sericytochromatia bacterium]|nr:hypothetical protein [Candidatus Sericytochromatia bacterium]